MDRGVNGSIKSLYNSPHKYTDKLPPISAIVTWIKSKNLIARDNAKYGGKESDFKHLDDEQKIVNMAWAISRKIYSEGFAPRYIYSKEIPQLLTDLSEQLGNIAIQQINQIIDVKDSAKRTIIKL